MSMTSEAKTEQARQVHALFVHRRSESQVDPKTGCVWVKLNPQTFGVLERARKYYAEFSPTRVSLSDVVANIALGAADTLSGFADVVYPVLDRSRRPGSPRRVRMKKTGLLDSRPLDEARGEGNSSGLTQGR
jgi:hypothetical protein